MAYLDPRSPLFTASLSPEPETDPLQEMADRVFAELAFEMGTGESDVMVQGAGPDGATLVYDKFSGRRR